MHFCTTVGIILVSNNHKSLAFLTHNSLQLANFIEPRSLNLIIKKKTNPDKNGKFCKDQPPKFFLNCVNFKVQYINLMPKYALRCANQY